MCKGHSGLPALESETLPQTNNTWTSCSDWLAAQGHFGPASFKGNEGRSLRTTNAGKVSAWRGGPLTVPRGVARPVDPCAIIARGGQSSDAAGCWPDPADHI
ncbi:hypothetical protein AAFF_G00349820 [Aldrovandia affinis]|uniref:Uncharacterized protein n=1 Tax=Aldrovandia affinis TaxID=143900 RepID=A0AAD7SLI9_9TELE|nr:hypothetical protein AAFF_G00349820 [Aldrovandia affinis]